MSNVLFIGALIGIMYFVLIRPQQKQQKETQNMLSALKKGDEVITQGGLLGKVFEIREKIVTLEVSQGTKLRVLKSSIQGITAPEKKEDEKKSEESKDSKGEK